MSNRKELRRIAAAAESAAVVPSDRNTAHESAADRRATVPFWARLMLAWGGGPAALRTARRVLDDFEIVGFIGPNGGGKTLALMVFTESTRAGQTWHCDLPFHEHTKRGITSGQRMMLSTVPILDGHSNPHPLWIEFNDFQQLLDIEHADCYMDEVVTVASSRDSARMDPRVLVKLNQLRKDDIFLYWTAPNLARADKSIREVTKALVECRGFAPAPRDANGPRWRSKRIFKFSAYDSVEFEQWSASKRDAVRPLYTLWFNGVGSSAFSAYDTLSAVSMVASITPEDTCTVCDGRVTRHLCRCNDRKTPRRHETHSHAHDTSTFLGAPTENASAGVPV
jgi:hypothetical protein